MTPEQLSVQDETTVVENARIVTPSTVIERGHVTIEGDRIVTVDADNAGCDRRRADTRIDARGQLLLPGIVDLHGDDIERHLFPRSEARAPMAAAMVACDRANAAAGITTKFHAVAFEDAPDKHRSIDLGREIVEAIENGVGGDRLIDHRVHARCEIGDRGAVEAVSDLVDREHLGLVSLMNHVPGQGQFDDWQDFSRRYLDGRQAIEQRGRAVVDRRQQRDGTSQKRVDRLISRATAANTPVASHDDERPEKVEEADSRGVTISEYPVTMAAARRAVDLGMTTAMGSPNLVRGGSLWGNLAAAEAIDAGVVDVLCSDYRPASMLEAPFVETGEPLPERVARVTRNPARAAGLDDRGRIAEGARADLILVDPDPQPTVERSFVGGRESYRASQPV